MEEKDIFSQSENPGENGDSPEIMVSRILTEKGLSMSTAESCTGGRIAARITALPGSSTYFKGSIVAYDNSVKESVLHVSAETLERKGAVSEETVREMVVGAMKTFKTDCAVATSGIAGPSGGTPQKPTGTIWIAAACGDNIITMKQEGDQGRINNMNRAAGNALLLLYKVVKDRKIAITQ